MCEAQAEVDCMNVHLCVLEEHGLMCESEKESESVRLNYTKHVSLRRRSENKRLDTTSSKETPDQLPNRAIF